jgi:drug/metabolite transporter (DMT)-like permease
MTPVEWFLLVILGAVWGGTFFFNAIALPEVPPLTVIAFRVSLAGVLLWIYILISGVAIPRELRVWGAVGVMAIANTVVPFFFIAWGQLHITSGLAAILIASSPLYAVVAAHFFTSDERMTSGKLAGVVSGITGVVFLIGPGVLKGLGADLLGQIAIVGAALCYAGSAIYGRRFARWKVSPRFMATGQMTLAALIMLPCALILEQPWSLPSPSFQAWGAMLGLAVLATALGYLIYFRILGSAGAINILLVNFLVPVSALLLGIFILGEELTAGQGVGMAFIAFGLALIDGRIFARLRSMGKAR